MCIILICRNYYIFYWMSMNEVLLSLKLKPEKVTIGVTCHLMWHLEGILNNSSVSEPNFYYYELIILMNEEFLSITSLTLKLCTLKDFKTFRFSSFNISTIIGYNPVHINARVFSLHFFFIFLSLVVIQSDVKQ